MELRIRRLHPESDADIELPRAMSDGAAGLDVRAAAPSVLQPGQWAAIPTGLQMAVPVGVEIQVRPRSGLAFKHGVTVLNAPGTIDADYRGEVKVLLINHGSAPFAIERGMRVAQLVVAEVAPVTVVEIDELDGTRRGTAGFGSTGTAG
ncbi:MAG: dUTP diphosphatase [Proteobacteria bacterium]|nr:dUTP diphosphatase [Pseudomonadota bacterium]